ncbi:hypothetical protein LTR94_035130, partial [Friedmanniomyces endolithicus]
YQHGRRQRDQWQLHLYRRTDRDRADRVDRVPDRAKHRPGGHRRQYARAPAELCDHRRAGPRHAERHGAEPDLYARRRRAGHRQLHLHRQQRGQHLRARDGDRDDRRPDADHRRAACERD